MWIAIHIRVNREHIGSKEPVKSLYIEREETATQNIHSAQAGARLVSSLETVDLG
jgi:hypothetical protein